MLNRVYLPDVKITLLNSTKYKNIGVGESTQPGLVLLLQAAGINVFDFMKETDGIMKHGIYFREWNGKGTEFWHPFSPLTDSGNYTAAHHYHIKHNNEPVKYPLKDYYKRVHPSYTLCVENNTASTTMPYALHLDADKLAVYIRKYLANSIEIIDMDEYSVDYTPEKINSITCDGNRVEADLYVDCTGFNRVLIGKMAGLVEDDYESNVNSALFGRVHYTSENVKKFPYTRADAWDNGWIWTTPLNSKVGSGCVYNDKFCTEDEAKDYFVEYWQGALKRENIRKVSFNGQSLKNPWVSNVVANGLSAGFVEPLEATGISWFVNGSQVLGSLLRSRYYDEALANRFNSMMGAFVEDVQDFIDAHYMYSSRRDTEFWRYQTSRKRSDRLLAKMQLYKKQMPNKNNRSPEYIWAFNEVSWIDVLTGFNFEFDPINVDPAFYDQRRFELYE
jgi:tryptophan halogenase